MDFEEFKERAAAEIRKLAGGARVELREVRKNNGRKLAGMTAVREGAEVSPVIYLDDFYAEPMGEEEFVRAVQKIREELLEREVPKADLSGLARWEDAKGSVFVRLVNREANAELLEGVPHRDFLDLAEVYYYAADMGKDGTATVLIGDGLLGLWGAGAEELRERARANYKSRLGTMIKGMGETLAEILGTDPTGAFGEHEPPLQMSVATNRRRLYGAAAMLFPEEFAGPAEEAGGDLYVLPSSVHEVLLLPASSGKPEELAEIVREVNRTQVMPEERLSDSVYRFCRESGEIKIA